MLIFDQVTKVYGNGTKALDNISFAVGEGDFVVLQGKSGAGKSTVIKLSLKETPLSSGKIIIDGDDIAKISDKNIPQLRRKLGVVFQDFKILFDRTVAENIDVALDILGLAPRVVIERRNELLKLTGIEDKKNLFPVQLSGGELQRVGIARALSVEPKILFADEPTGNLDKETGGSIIKLLQEINSQGTTIIMASHDLELVKSAKPRIITLESGQITHDTGAKIHEKE